VIKFVSWNLFNLSSTLRIVIKACTGRFSDEKINSYYSLTFRHPNVNYDSRGGHLQARGHSEVRLARFHAYARNEEWAAITTGSQGVIIHYVYTDISGLLVGDRLYFEGIGREPVILNEFRHALIYAARWDNILFGTDWPLAPMDAYCEFVARLVPEKYLENVLGKNVLNIFTRIPIN